MEVASSTALDMASTGARLCLSAAIECLFCADLYVSLAAPMAQSSSRKRRLANFVLVENGMAINVVAPIKDFADRRTTQRPWWLLQSPPPPPSRSPPSMKPTWNAMVSPSWVGRRTMEERQSPRPRTWAWTLGKGDQLRGQVSLLVWLLKWWLYLGVSMTSSGKSCAIVFQECHTSREGRRG